MGEPLNPKDKPAPDNRRTAATLQLEAAMAGLDDQVAIYDREWRYVYVNRRAREVLGKPEEELLGHSIWELFPDAVGNQYYLEVHRAASQDQAIHSEHYYAPFDRWFENHIYPFAGGICVISRDISDRKRAEAGREQLLAQLEAVTRQMPAAVLIADTEGRLLFANEQVTAILGMSFPPGTAMLEVGRDFPAFRRDGRPLSLEERPLHRALHGETVHGEEVRVSLPAGAWFFLEIHAAPVRDAEGRISAAVIIFQEVTERRRAYDALREADRRKDEFLAMLSHELRNPLAPIQNAVELLRLEKASPAHRERAQAILERQVRHLTRLVDDLLDVSRITQGKVSLRQDTVDLADLITRAVETAEPLLDSRRQQLTVGLPERRILLHGDLIRLSQVLGNLLNNAAKFTPNGGHIEIRATLESSHAVVRVRDNGIGIPAEDLPKVFDLFVQAERSLARSEGGLGIGLTLVRRLVELHGGTVEARSEGIGRGSEMVVRLPARGD